LPTDDLDDADVELYGSFAGGELVGMIGLQRCGGRGLLRSLAVAPAARSHGVAAALCRGLLDLAARRGLPELWLLTTSARDYFPRHGFAAVARDEAPQEIRATAQFSSLCPASAVVMRRALP
jgi:amino-acid N-acetyltransferase